MSPLLSPSFLATKVVEQWWEPQKKTAPSLIVALDDGRFATFGWDDSCNYVSFAIAADDVAVDLPCSPDVYGLTLEEVEALRLMVEARAEEWRFETYEPSEAAE